MLIIDRFEGETAVCESENGFLSLPKGKILGEAKEGDVLIPKGEQFIVDKEETNRRREEAAAKLKKLLQRKK